MNLLNIDGSSTAVKKRKKLLLVSSWTNSKDVLGYYLSPPMGLYRIQNWLRDKHDVDVLDPNIEDPIAHMDREESYDYVGFSPTKDNLHNDIAMMRYARKRYPASPILIGGVEATFGYGRFLDNKLADMVVIGEGEKVMERLLDDETDTIPRYMSTITRHYDPETVLHSEELGRATDIDFSKFPVREYWKRNEDVAPDADSRNTVNLYITNFCPQGCKFCSTTQFVREGAGSGVTMVPPQHLVKIIHKVKEQIPETRTIYFHDDNAIHHKGPTLEWTKQIAEDKLDVTFVATSRINHFDEEVVDSLIPAGFRKVSVGVEAYTDSLLKTLRKAQRRKNIDRFLEITKAVDLPVHMNLMLCQPESEVDDVVQTAEFALRVIEENKLNTVTAEPHIKAYSGSWYMNNWDLIEYSYRTVPSINGTRSEEIRIPWRFIPRDPIVRRLLGELDEAYASGDFFVKKRSGSYLTSQLTESLCKLILELVPKYQRVPSRILAKPNGKTISGIASSKKEAKQEAPLVAEAEVEAFKVSASGTESTKFPRQY